jgi:ssDNA-binding Zn-finger/Zn-ribbon topoisomerase 1
VKAEDETYRTEQKTYYCPCKECSAEMTLRHSAKGTPYFAAKRNNPHSRNCRFSVPGFGDTEYSTDDFDFNSFFDLISHEDENGSTKHSSRQTEESYSGARQKSVTPRTVYQLYRYSIECYYSNTYDEKIPRGLLLFEENEQNFFNVDNERHLVECIFENEFFSASYGSTFSFLFPAKTDGSKTIFLHPSDVKVEYALERKLNGKSKRNLIIILAKFKRKGRFLDATVSSSKQIYVSSVILAQEEK